MGSLVMIEGHPCEIVSLLTSKTGNHGAARAYAWITGIDIFTANIYECTFSTDENVDLPIVQRKEYTLVDIDDEGFMALMNESGEIKEDLKLPNDEWLKDVTERAK